MQWNTCIGQRVLKWIFCQPSEKFITVHFQKSRLYSNKSEQAQKQTGEKEALLLKIKGNCRLQNLESQKMYTVIYK